MYRILFLIISLLSLHICATAQMTIHEKAKMYIKAGNYSRALNEYKRAYAKDSNNVKTLRGIIECIVSDENPREAAIPYCERYAELNPDDVDFYFDYATACYHGHQFSKATQQLSNYISMVDKKNKMDKADKLLLSITNAQKMLKNPLAARLVNMGPMINTEHSEINPFITDDDKTIVFSSDEKYNSTEQINYFNIKFSENDGYAWIKSKAVGGLVNTLYDEYITGLCGKTMFFCHNRAVDFAIGTCKYLGKGRFSDGEDMGKPIDMKGDEVAATLTPSGDTLIFSGTSISGHLDLYYTIKMQNGEWGMPRLLPGLVNTQDADQSYPMIDLDGKRLYFASNGETSMGGYDIYYSDFDTQTNTWGKPIQMPYPINDTYDNMTISFSSDRRYAYISAIRPEGIGNRDIYQVVNNDVVPSAALFRYEILIKRKPKPTTPQTTPLVQVFDKDGNIVAHVNVSMPEATFLLALDPGDYKLTIDADATKQYVEDITVFEMVHSSEPLEKKAILIPEVEEIKLRLKKRL